MGGLTFQKLAIVLVIALIVLGPERLPYYAQKLGEFVKTIRRMTEGAKERVKEEMGDEYDEVDWKQLDPRQYDPRRIIRDALDEEERSPEARRARAVAASRSRKRPAEGAVEGAAAAGAAGGLSAMYGSSHEIASDFNFDDEAT
ncbi:twin-arginine translocase TatA/TatE family subunit [Leucobacter sp. UCMA 4100]|uniref:Sec-independent protein translocase subunit TatA/TatB n=1 Tax=Leucobacter sp. UCMA 4100 TaxID=2810534 RepID=UPI0022EB75E5|nr:twin-arginine translocase TatA/TatE family subunit [Leucobacter sp. UCMA 4100]MDA3146067.1 twin-arginine translocase TatA/TatE family subunit [Leucobacter sp. UCMA 4100]